MVLTRYAAMCRTIPSRRTLRIIYGNPEPRPQKMHEMRKTEGAPSEFYLRSTISKRTGQKPLAQECKKCTQRRTQKRYRAKYQEIRLKDNAYAKERRAMIREAVFAAYGGYRCACCGETEKCFLTLDHINNDGADFRRKLVGSQARGGGYVTYRHLFTRGFPPGFQVLCANCQHGKRMNNGTCPHQVRRNDHPLVGVEPSGSKRSAPDSGDDMVSSASKVAAAL